MVSEMTSFLEHVAGAAQLLPPTCGVELIALGAAA